MLTRRKRRLIFYALTLVFLGLGTGVVFYVQGYRLDLQTLAVSKIGAIYIRTFPGDAVIRLNGDQIRRPFSIFQTGVLINDLFPKTYTITAERDGFTTWKKTVSIEPTMVVKFEYAVLVPDRPETFSPEPAADIRIVGAEPLITSPNNRITWRGNHLATGTVIGVTNDGNRMLVQAAQTGRYIWYDLGTEGSIPIAPLLSSANIPNTAKLLIEPEDSSRLIARTSKTLTLLNLQTNSAHTLATSTPAFTLLEAFASSRTRLVWATFSKASGTSVVTIFNKGENAEETRTKPLEGKTVKFIWATNDVLAILQNTGTLYVYHVPSRTLTARANDVKDFSFSEDGTMLAALENRSIEVFSLTREDYWRLNLPEVEAIKHIDWYKDKFHLILHYPVRVDFVGLEDRSLENIHTIAKTGNAVYDVDANALYYIADQTLSRLQFPG